jgi:hypothetical protein
MTLAAPEARAAFLSLSSALEERDFCGWDPFDALASPVLNKAAQTRLMRGGLIQLLKRSPLNLRPLLGVPQMQHTKGLALCTSAYAHMAHLEPEAGWGERAEDLAQRLVGRAVPAGDGLGWGYDFDVQTRWAYYRRGQPNAIVSTFTAHALLDVADLLDQDDLRTVARKTLRYVRKDLLRDADGEPFFAYYRESTVPIHNANMLVAGLLARCGDDADAELARRAAGFTITRQGSDGSWAYGVGPRLGWVDGYHTAYVLDGLRLLRERDPDDAVDTAIVRGLTLYLERLFDPDGAPRATVESRWPVDVHAASSAISTLSALARFDPRSLAMAARVLKWTQEHLRRRDGRYAFQVRPRFRNGTSYFRWNDAHMLLALARHAVATAPSSR